MARVIIKVGTDEYVLYSDVEQKPVTPILSQDELSQVLLCEKVKTVISDIVDLFKQAEAKASSDLPDMLMANQAGSDGENLSLVRLREQYAKPVGWRPPQLKFH